MKAQMDLSMQCPKPLSDTGKIQLAHGGGGKRTQDLIEKIFMPAFQNPFLDARHDGAVMDIAGAKLAFSTDSYVVRPLFFPGGDIGSMAVYGTVNDLAMCGAKPLYLSAAFILEEGLEIDTLSRIVRSMAAAAKRSGVILVTGDTKVVDRGKGDGVFINTSGVGVIEHALDISPKSVRAGDIILLSGDVGRHGMAVMAVREGLSFESSIESDSAPVTDIVEKLLNERIEMHCLRDLTRGGLSSALNEIAQTSALSVRIIEKDISVREDVRAACEILGLDPYYVANEGRFIAFVPPGQSSRALALMRSFSAEAAIIGEVKQEMNAGVQMMCKLGNHRMLDMLTGEQLPRIC